jgi:hypothetical protein
MLIHGTCIPCLAYKRVCKLICLKVLLFESTFGLIEGTCMMHNAYVDSRHVRDASAD